MSRIKSETVARKTAADDEDIVRYMMQLWAVSWIRSAVLEVILTVADMHMVLDVALDIDVALA